MVGGWVWAAATASFGFGLSLTNLFLFSFFFPETYKTYPISREASDWRQLLFLFVHDWFGRGEGKGDT